MQVCVKDLNLHAYLDIIHTIIRQCNDISLVLLLEEMPRFSLNEKIDRGKSVCWYRYMLRREDGYVLRREDVYVLRKDDGYVLRLEDGYVLGREDVYVLKREDVDVFRREDGYVLRRVMCWGWWMVMC